MTIIRPTAHQKPGSPEASKPFSMADLVSFLETAPNLEPKRRRDLKSAVRRLCDLVGRDPEHVAADVQALRGAIRTLHPAQAGLSAKTVANIKANVLAALRMVRADGIAPAPRAPLSVQWQELFSLLPGRRLKPGLSRFVHFCSRQGIDPNSVDDSTFDAFAQFLRTETFVAKPNDLLRRTARLWNEATEACESWPKRPLSVPSFRAARRTIPLADLPQPFQDEVAAHLRWLQGEDLFCEHPPPKVCKAATAELRRKHIEGAASAYIASGSDRDRLLSLADLVTPEAMEAILRQYLARTNNEPSQYHRDLAKTLILIARHWIRLDETALATLVDLKRRLGPDRSGLTDKNKAMLRQFDDEANQARLLMLPGRLMKQAERRPADDIHAAVLAQTAAAIEILLMAPMRMGNLLQLRIDQHLTCHGEELQLILPAEETKGGDEIVYPLAGESRQLVELYLRRFRPRLCSDDCPWLLPTKNGTRKSQRTLSQQIVDTVRKHTGLILTVHQFRHLSAKLLLDDQPGNYEGARQLLGHRNLKSTVSFYTGLKTPQAAREFDALLAEKRRAFEETPPERPRQQRWR